MPDRRILLDASDGPEGITIYTSEDEGVVDWSPTLPGLYVTVNINGATARFGPFTLASIREKVEEALGIAAPLKVGDKVTPINGRALWTATISRIEVQESSFPAYHKEEIAFFEGGGFWRLSQLRLA